MKFSFKMQVRIYILNFILNVKVCCNKQYTCWIHNRLGKGVRNVIPSCALWEIPNKSLSQDNKHANFVESAIDMN